MLRQFNQPPAATAVAVFGTGVYGAGTIEAVETGCAMVLSGSGLKVDDTWVSPPNWCSRQARFKPSEKGVYLFAHGAQRGRSLTTTSNFACCIAALLVCCADASVDSHSFLPAPLFPESIYNNLGSAADRYPPGVRPLRQNVRPKRLVLTPVWNISATSSLTAWSCRLGLRDGTSTGAGGIW
jgi:hypothetical protein